MQDDTESPRVMTSTPVPSTITRPDGTITTSTARVVHAPGDPVPAAIQHTCGPTCGRCAS